MPFSNLWRHGWTRALFSFGAMHTATLLLPLLAFPWLGRKLEPECFGLLMYMCIFPPIITLFMEWGFPLGGARLAARARDKPQALSDILGNVISAKLILAPCCVGLCIVAMPFLPYVRDFPMPYFMAILLGIGKGLTPLWFYQGTGRHLRRLAFWDVTSSLLALALVFLFVRQPEDWSLYLVFTALCKLVSNSGLTILVWRENAAEINLRAGWLLLRQMRFLFSGLFFTTVYHYSTQLVLGYFLPARQMGIMVAMGKMLRALASMVMPFTQTIFPEVCILRDIQPQKARFVLRNSLLLTFMGTAALVAIIWPFTSLLVHIAIGPAYRDSAQIFNIMLLAAPFSTCNHVLGLQTLVPFGHEKSQAAIRFWATISSLPLAATLGCLGGLQGAAFLPLCVEGGIFTAFVMAIIKLCPEAFFSSSPIRNDRD